MKIKLNLKYLLVLFFLYLPSKCLALGPLSSNVLADISVQDLAVSDGKGFVITFGIGDAVNLIIKSFLSLLGIIFIILVITAGYNWMTAVGDETKVEKAKKMITRAVIGLIVIISAYAITAFVFKALDGAVQ
ncbi:MAG: hypothetical protein U9Q85_02385 [Patescibacteria group bacterium]|nr:hypothetical protein [Patescibacteria group bacterium]